MNVALLYFLHNSGFPRFLVRSYHFTTYTYIYVEFHNTKNGVVKFHLCVCVS